MPALHAAADLEPSPSMSPASSPAKSRDSSSSGMPDSSNHRGYSWLMWGSGESKSTEAGHSGKNEESCDAAQQSIRSLIPALKGDNHFRIKRAPSPIEDPSSDTTGDVGSQERNGVKTAPALEQRFNSEAVARVLGTALDVKLEMASDISGNAQNTSRILTPVLRARFAQVTARIIAANPARAAEPAGSAETTIMSRNPESLARGSFTWASAIMRDIHEKDPALAPILKRRFSRLIAQLRVSQHISTAVPTTRSVSYDTSADRLPDHDAKDPILSPVLAQRFAKLSAQLTNLKPAAGSTLTSGSKTQEQPTRFHRQIPTDQDSCLPWVGWPLCNPKHNQRPKRKTLDQNSETCNQHDLLSGRSLRTKRQRVSYTEPPDLRYCSWDIHDKSAPLSQLSSELANTFIKPKAKPSSKVKSKDVDATVAENNSSNTPQTPRRSRRTTAHTSPHFYLDHRGTESLVARSPLHSTAKTSGHFSSPRKRAGESAIEFPALKAGSFGLIQEHLASNPFHVLVAVTFLTKTSGTTAVPTIRKFIEDYPTPESLATVTPVDLFPDIQHLGLGNNRAKVLIELAKMWVANPPEKGKRYRKPNYPDKGSGKDILPREEPLADDEMDPRVAFEIAHLPGVGPYGLDSWRIFCRDNLRGKPSGIQKKTVKGDEAAIEIEMGQEWTRILPQDKELRAYLKWRWLRLGVNWNPTTGEKEAIDRDVLKKMQKGHLTEHEGFTSPWKERF